MATGLPSRRLFLSGLGGLGCSAVGVALVAAWGSLPTWLQTPKVHRVAVLMSGNPLPEPVPNIEPFRRQLRELGWTEGKNLVVEQRVGLEQDLPTLAADLVGMDVEVIVAKATPATMAAKAATSAIPIVTIGSGQDLLQLGWVESLARPGGNITGISTFNLGSSLLAKQLSLLKELSPTATRVAHLWDAAAFGSYPSSMLHCSCATTLRVQLQPLEVRAPEDLENAFKMATMNGADALVSVSTPMLERVRTRIAALALRSKLPSIFPFTEFAAAGGLMAYGPNTDHQLQRAAIYVDKILKGAKAADLPIEQPDTFDFVVNLKTAQSLGLTISQAMLQQATGIIQ
jgi:putative ABC transport system substrate-binding protein